MIIGNLDNSGVSGQTFDVIILIISAIYTFGDPSTW